MYMCIDRLGSELEADRSVEDGQTCTPWVYRNEREKENEANRGARMLGNRDVS